MLLLTTLAGCKGDKLQQEIVKWRVTLDKEDKRPYGTYLAYQSLKYYFPGATVAPLSRGFRYSSMDNKMKSNNSGHTLMVLEGLDFYVSENEWEELKSFMSD